MAVEDPKERRKRFIEEIHRDEPAPSRRRRKAARRFTRRLLKERHGNAKRSLRPRPKHEDERESQ